MRRFPSFRRPLIVLALLAAGSLQSAWAQQGPERGGDGSRERGAPRSEDRGHRNSMSDSVRRVRSETGGQVLSVERMQYDGRDVNRVKYIDDRGRVRTQDDVGPMRRNADAPVRPRRDVAPPQPQPPRGDNPPRP